VKTVTVVDKPRPSFTISQNNQCVNNVIVFTNTTITNVNTSYAWNFGDATISNQTSVAHNYSTSGTYTVTLTATNDAGCVESVSQTIFVAPKPVTSFTTQDVNACSGDYVAAFTNTTTGNISSYVWTFNDGTISTDINPTHTYTNAGSYIVKLLAISVSGCRDSISKTITLQSHLSSAFTINNVTQCINSNSFSFRSVSAGQSNLTYKWDFGDGTTAATAAVTKTYLLAGTYTVKLLVANIVTGCNDSSTTIVNVNFQPSARLVGSGTICNGNSFIINVNFAGTPPFSFTYNDGTSNHFISGINTVVYGLGVSPTTTTTYRIIAMNDAYCSASTADVASTSSTVTVNNVTFAMHPASTTTCVGSGASLLASATANTEFTYQWQKNGVDILGATDSVYKITTTSLIDNGTYRIALVLACGRMYSNTAYMNVVAAPLPPAFSTNVSRCQYDTARPLVASGDLLLWYTTAIGGLSSPVAPMPNTLLLGTQQYWVSNSNVFGCESQRYLMTVTILPSPTVTIDVIGSTVLLPSQSTTLIASPSINTASLIWLRNDQIVSSNSTNQLAVGFNALGRYQALAAASNGCKTLSNIIEITAPRGLEPRAEGINLRLYPNPATTVVNAYFDNPVNQTLTVKLVNALGQQLQSKVVNYTSRFQLVQFDVSRLGYDVYSIEVLNLFGNTIARNLFVKAK
jgi:PKD repeat protein